MEETRVLGDYILVKQIGQGALGAVHLVEHRFMNTQYVLKVLPDELASDRKFIQRFEEKVGVLATLEHPNIVKIHNVSSSQGSYFLVTDCIVDDVGETTNLTQYFVGKQLALGEEKLFHILRQIADALDYAHLTKGLVHGGVKLNNVLISQGKDDTQVFLSDFGLSPIIGSGIVMARTFKTITDTLGLGTVAMDVYPSIAPDAQKLSALQTSFLQHYLFLSPEQKRGEPVGVKSDIYAFGVLAYYLMMRQFPEGVFPMPSERHTNYRWNWDDLIQGCLQSDPSKRPEHLLPLLEAVKGGGRQSHPQAEEIIEQAHPKTERMIEQGWPVSSPPRQRELRPVIQSGKLERPKVDPDPGAIFQASTTVKHYVPERKEVQDIQPIMTDMVIIKGGKFYRGSNDGSRDEMPRHQVTVSSFAIDIHPVTNEQFVRFLEVMGGEKDRNHHDIIRIKDSRIKRSGGKVSIESGYAKHPVVGVTWYGAVAYAKWVGKRLPTEAEWEIAACGGNEGQLYPTGEDIEKTQANFFSSDTTAVMSYAPNEYGLYDMSGNVYEWCHDWYGYNYYETSIQEPDQPKGPIQGVYRALRGGCWKSLKEDLRCSRRHRNNPGTVNGTYGFRCVADVK